MTNVNVTGLYFFNSDLQPPRTNPNILFLSLRLQVRVTPFEVDLTIRFLQLVAFQARSGSLKSDLCIRVKDFKLIIELKSRTHVRKG